MSRSVSAGVLLVTSLLCSIRQGSPYNDWWMNLPYENDGNFNYNVELNHDVSVPCNDSSVPDGYVMQYWIRPDMKVMFPGETFQFWTLDGDASWHVNTTSQAMDIHLLQENMFGFYYCVMDTVPPSSPPNLYAVKKGINYEEAYWGDLWDKYGRAVCIALAASGGFLVLCMVVLLVCKFYYKGNDADDDEDVADDEDMSGKTSRSLTLGSDVSSSPSHQGRYDLAKEAKYVMTTSEVHENAAYDVSSEGTSGLGSKIATEDRDSYEGLTGTKEVAVYETIHDGTDL